MNTRKEHTMNQSLRGATLGVALASGLLFSAVAQHGFAHADGGPAITVDPSVLAAAASMTASTSGPVSIVDPSALAATVSMTANPPSTTGTGTSSADPLPADFTPIHIDASALPVAHADAPSFAASTAGTTPLPADFTPVHLGN